MQLGFNMSNGVTDTLESKFNTDLFDSGGKYLCTKGFID